VAGGGAMSVRAVAFVADFEGLTIAERCVAFVLARYASHPDALTWPSMNTVAKKASLKNRQTASDITSRLVQKGVLTIHTLSKGGRKNPTKYQFNFAYNCNPPIAVDAEADDSNCNPTVAVDGGSNCNSPVAVSDEEQTILTATPDDRNCNPEPTQLQPKRGLTAIPQLHEGFRRGTTKGKAKRKASRFERGALNHHHRLNTPELNDDDREPSQPPPENPDPPNPVEKAEAQLVHEGEPQELVTEALRLLDERVVKLEKYPVSPTYWTTAYRNLKANPTEWNVVLHNVNLRHARREKYMPGFDPTVVRPTDEQEFLNEAVAEHQRTGKPVKEIIEGMLARPRPNGRNGHG
jgi:hypothetical protein